MAKKILQGVGILAAPFTGGASLALTAGASLLPGKKKKTTETTAAATAPKKGPIITQLGKSSPPLARPPVLRGGYPTILSDKLGA